MTQLIEIRPGRHINPGLIPHPNSNQTLFLLHGLGGRSNQWREQIPLLTTQYNLVVPDIVGHGASPEPAPQANNNPYRFSELQADWQALFDRYATASNIIIGHSYGGALAASLSMNNQSKIQKLILITPVPCQSNFPIPLAYSLPTLIMEWLRPLIELTYKSAIFTKDANPALVKTELQFIHNTPITLLKQMIKGMKDMPNLSIRELNIPTLMLTAIKDGLVSPQEQFDFYQHLPKHIFKQFENSAHLIHLQQPELVNPAILDFLNKP